MVNISITFKNITTKTFGTTLLTIHRKNNYVTLLLPKANQHLVDKLHSDWFQIDFWENNNSIAGHSKGRNTAWFINYQEESWVLRHYYRGGFIAKLLIDCYFFTRTENTRIYQELNLLSIMHSEGFPVPKPIAGRIIKSVLFYRNDILVEKIPNSETLAKTLSLKPLTEKLWKAVGSLIAQFHHAGIYHSDLNSHNILLDNNDKLWLIDFDKCKTIKTSNDWKKKNLNRLKRSFEKEKNKTTDFYFDEKCWQWLLDGYDRV